MEFRSLDELSVAGDVLGVAHKLTFPDVPVFALVIQANHGGGDVAVVVPLVHYLAVSSGGRGHRLFVLGLDHCGFRSRRNRNRDCSRLFVLGLDHCGFRTRRNRNGDWRWRREVLAVCRKTFLAGVDDAGLGVGLVPLDVIPGLVRSEVAVSAASARRCYEEALGG
jgi:hypothetical protein